MHPKIERLFWLHNNQIILQLLVTATNINVSNIIEALEYNANTTFYQIFIIYTAKQILWQGDEFT